MSTITHENRGRLTANPAGNWRLYSETLPDGATPIGTVTRDGNDTGALVRFQSTGRYAQINCGAVRNLDGRKVAGALGMLPGRPLGTGTGKRVNVYLDALSLAAAAALGDGNVSLGIREALRQAQPSAKK